MNVFSKAFIASLSKYCLKQRDIAERTGIGTGRISEYVQGKRVPTQEIQIKIAHAFDLDLLQFLALGASEEDVASRGGGLQTDPAPVQDSSPQQPFKVIGLAKCGIMGWEMGMSLLITVSPPALGPQAFAVFATGDSMAPEGILEGMLCYCDPDAQPIVGDAVYVEQTNKMATIKRFGGWTTKNNDKWLRLYGYMDKDGGGAQKPFTLEIIGADVSRIATVTYIRRRI